MWTGYIWVLQSDNNIISNYNATSMVDMTDEVFNLLLIRQYKWTALCPLLVQPWKIADSDVGVSDGDKSDHHFGRTTCCIHHINTICHPCASSGVTSDWIYSQTTCHIHYTGTVSHLCVFAGELWEFLLWRRTRHICHTGMVSHPCASAGELSEFRLWWKPCHIRHTDTVSPQYASVGELS